ncbi:polyprenyl synthetase family protein [Bombilactobacillus bombi]|uniref:polyprenyl synthetase family protein n=1 Tax=Bombilactobacillus bombi TaxID=1303590 RepID=UPI0015E5EEA4|nr:farnesyl diphosphate synthase [Bombilactobacillus bombi]MBA1435141.1 polyprenyl synthetase family protein [Bombilactobacillus bombi]
MNQFQKFQSQYLEHFNDFLHQQLVQEIVQPQLQSSMLYSLDAGGKRIRPFLLLATVKSLQPQADLETYFKIAGSLELVHTYSLIHDDLPEMDNDDYRRGQLTNHKKFTPAQAVLAGDALLTQAFLWLTDNSLVPVLQSQLVWTLANAAGGQGMVAGQTIDIINTGKKLDLTQITTLDAQKTGALITAAVKMGALCTQADQEQLMHLQRFAQNFGVAFQIYDDILDVTSTEAKMGKKVGKDQAVGKNTYVSLLGLPSAQERLAAIVHQAHQELQAISLADSILAASLEYFD